MHKNKKKDIIIADPIYGIITIKSGIVKKIIQHPYFQRLRRISQLGLVNIVYPAANHSRFQHAIGSLHLMQKTINHFNDMSSTISDQESDDLKLAILLHDIGHGPFSHALEKEIFINKSHEDISLNLMYLLNETFSGHLVGCIKIFKNVCKKKYLNQLVSSQLDMDRLDYIKRDSFFTGVIEGNIGSARIINMLKIKNNSLVAEEKGLYSIEKFLISREFMYWQVYLHKTVVVAENMLKKFFKRIKFLKKNKGVILDKYNPVYEIIDENIEEERKLRLFGKIDDYDIVYLIKLATRSNDFVLSKLSKMILNRNLLKIKFSEKEFQERDLKKYKCDFKKKYKIDEELAKYFIFTDKISNKLYDFKQKKIEILKKDGKTINISKISNQIKNSMLFDKKKYFLCYEEKI